MQYLLKDGRTIGGSVIVDFDPTHTNCVDRLTDEEKALFVQQVTPDPPVKVTTVTPRQARLALNAAGLLPQVDSAVAATDKATQITWEFTTTIDRDNPILAALAQALSLSSAQIDALFVAASQF